VEQRRVEATERDTRQGVTGHGVRYVLIIGTALAVIAMLVIGFVVLG
jgi:hypothetical protein